MAKFKMTELVTEGGSQTARLGTAGSANRYTDTEVGKAVKLSGDSAYVLAAAGDKIEGFVRAMEVASLDDFSIGTVQFEDRKSVVLDGDEATPGTGTVAIGDYVVVGTVVAKGTALSADCKVTKATNQPFAAVTTADNVAGNINAAIAKVTDASKNATFAWRVVSASGTAVGSTAVIERVNG